LTAGAARRRRRPRRTGWSSRTGSTRVIRRQKRGS
jgi:hypothetical protein